MRTHRHRERAIELELAEAAGMADAVRAHRALNPRHDVRLERIGDAWVLFDGPRSPLSRCIGLGLTASADELELPRIERFFERQRVEPQIDVCPYTDPRLVADLGERCYVPRSFRQVMTYDLRDLPARRGDGPAVIEIRDDELDEWSTVVARGFEDGREPGPLELGLTSRLRYAETVATYGAVIDGELAAGGAVRFVDEVALLFAAATLPDYRGRGAQTALIEARLARARDEGCRLAMMTASPGGASHRNAARVGFQVEYTKFVMRGPPVTRRGRERR